MGQREIETAASRPSATVPSVLGTASGRWGGSIEGNTQVDLHNNGTSHVGVVADAELPPAERIRALARHDHSDSVAYQSVAVAGLQILERVLRHEKAACMAAISLAQRDKLDAMVCALDQTVGALRMSLSVQGSQMLFACTQSRGKPASDERSWWFALTETIQALEDGIDAVSGIVSGQPKGGAARTLSGVIARLLHRHHNYLLTEAEQWIG